MLTTLKKKAKFDAHDRFKGLGSNNVMFKLLKLYRKLARCFFGGGNQNFNIFGFSDHSKN